MYFPIELDRTRNFRLGNKAICYAERKLKKSILSVANDMEEAGMTVDEMSIILWAGLQHEDKTLTPDKVTDLIDQYSNTRAALNIIGEALADAFGEGEEKASDPGNEGKNE